MDWLLNNPILFTIIIIAIVLIAVGLILYFFVFRKKIQVLLEEKRAKKQQQEAENAKSQELVSDVFKSKSVENSEKDSADFDEKLKTVINQSKNQKINARNFSDQIKKEELDSEPTEEEEVNIKEIMSQFSSNKKK